MKSNEWFFRKLSIYLSVLSFENLTLLFIKNGLEYQFRFFESDQLSEI